MSTNRPEVTIDYVESLLSKPSKPLEIEAPPALIWDSVNEEIMTPVATQKLPQDHVKVKPKFGRAAFGLAAALVLLAGLATVYVVDSSPSAQLLAMGEFQGTGEAKLSDDTISLDVGDLQAPDDHYYELWLLSVDSEGEVVDLVSLGDLDGNDNYAVPGQTDLDSFTVVDISLEPEDGDQAHSGNSILRGELA